MIPRGYPHVSGNQHRHMKYAEVRFIETPCFWDIPGLISFVPVCLVTCHCLVKVSRVSSWEQRECEWMTGHDCNTCCSFLHSERCSPDFFTRTSSKLENFPHVPSTNSLNINSNQVEWMYESKTYQPFHGRATNWATCRGDLP